ncbi:hypothetical protein J22TS3_13240 [Paenibacillus sp. J22TS3]|nr:hypothetical protein J22TS3_13240 [Paenibacillus sp. J22TS3]
MKDIFFAVGSFHFYCTTSETSNINSVYTKDVEELLGTCSNINNIKILDNKVFKIKHPRNILYYNDNEDEFMNDLSYNNLNEIFPHPSLLRVEFDLFIPQRV